MTIDTGQRSMRMQFQKLLFAILTGIVAAFMFIPATSAPVAMLGVPPMAVVVVVVAFYVIYQLYFVVRDVEYIFVSDTQLPDMLRVRHFKLRPFSSGRHAIEMPLRQLYDYELQRSWGGLRCRVVLRQRVEERLYVYPPFSITILNRGERAMLHACLSQHASNR